MGVHSFLPVSKQAEKSAGSSSCLLEAFKAALLSGAEGIYLVTDGQADHTHDFLLNQLPRLRKQFGEHWILNTIAFHCANEL